MSPCEPAVGLAPGEHSATFTFVRAELSENDCCYLCSRDPRETGILHWFREQDLLDVAGAQIAHMFRLGLWHVMPTEHHGFHIHVPPADFGKAQLDDPSSFYVSKCDLKRYAALLAGHDFLGFRTAVCADIQRQFAPTRKPAVQPQRNAFYSTELEWGTWS